MYLVMLVCLGVFLQSQPLFAQENNTASQPLEDFEPERDKLQPKVDQAGGLPKAEHPYSSLTIIISNGKFLRDKLSCFVPAARFENTHNLTYYLRADGTLCLIGNYPALINTVPVEDIVRHLKSAGEWSDHCSLKLIVDPRFDPGVDFGVALKLAQAFQEVGEKYDTFQFLVDLSKPTETGQSKSKGIEKVQGIEKDRQK